LLSSNFRAAFKRFLRKIPARAETLYASQRYEHTAAILFIGGSTRCAVEDAPGYILKPRQK
jgi:hypothetical protein